jgi:hypothetical protein
VLEVDVSALVSALKQFEWAAENMQRSWRRIPVAMRAKIGDVRVTLRADAEPVEEDGEVVELGRVRRTG